jgi:hypothetical protein
MNRKQIVLAVVLADFAVLTAYAVWQTGYVGLFELALSSWGAAQIFFDLLIALTLVLTWMMRDARERGISFLPYLLLTLALGSIGPLVYLIRRESRATVPAGLAHAPQRA